MRAQDDDAADKPGDRAAGNAGSTISSGSVMPKCAARDAGRIGAGAEQRGMAERRDAAIAGHEIERQHQQGDGDDAGQQSQIVGKQEIADGRRQPDDDGDADQDRCAGDGLAPVAGDGRCCRCMRHASSRLPARPRGNTQTMAITAR